MRPPMNCREAIARLADYLDARLSSTARARLDAHLTVCPRCVEFLVSYEATPGIVRRATSPALPARIRRRLHTTIRSVQTGA